jgi:hypothetical protein
MLGVTFQLLSGRVPELGILIRPIWLAHDAVIIEQKVIHEQTESMSTRFRLNVLHPSGAHAGELSISHSSGYDELSLGTASNDIGVGFSSTGVAGQSQYHWRAYRRTHPDFSIKEGVVQLWSEVQTVSGEHDRNSLIVDAENILSGQASVPQLFNSMIQDTQGSFVVSMK